MRRHHVLLTTVTGIVLTAFAVSACRTPSSQSLVRDGETEQETDAPDPMTVANMQRIDEQCASCHAGDDNPDVVSFTFLDNMIGKTVNIHSCLEQKQCYNGLLPDTEAPQTPDQIEAYRQDCWVGCIMGSGGMTVNGGLYHAATRPGSLVHEIAVQAGLNGAEATRSMNRMSPGGNPRNNQRDIVADSQSFVQIANWMAREFISDYPNIVKVRPRTVQGAGVAQCDQFSPVLDQLIIDDVRSHLEGQSIQLSMVGCEEEWPDNPKSCFANLPASQYVDSGTPGLVVKIARELENRRRSSYWMRTSADGRFASVGNGIIEDLAIEDRYIEVLDDSIDPVFSPDNSVYAWPGMICPVAPLRDPSLTEVGTDVSASGCVSRSVGVYGSMGTDVNGEILLIDGYTNNNGGSPYGGRDASGMPGENGSFNMRRISGNNLSRERLTFVTPFETDVQMSPSGQTMVGRFMRDSGDNQTEQAFRIRAVRPDGRTINPSEMSTTGTICMKGEKANISFDNRFVAFHHYSDGSPQDEGTTPGQSNVFIYDLKEKRGMRVTNMPTGEGAFFPHFRADGWLIFQIKRSDGPEAIAVSNVALLMADPTDATKNCCKICTQGKACGDSCIESSEQCRQPVGCACDG